MKNIKKIEENWELEEIKECEDESCISLLSFEPENSGYDSLLKSNSFEDNNLEMILCELYDLVKEYGVSEIENNIIIIIRTINLKNCLNKDNEIVFDLVMKNGGCELTEEYIKKYIKLVKKSGVAYCCDDYLSDPYFKKNKLKI
jgi:hypothetical protein